jgi:hypothetical protein
MASRPRASSRRLGLRLSAIRPARAFARSRMRTRARRPRSGRGPRRPSRAFRESRRGKACFLSDPAVNPSGRIPRVSGIQRGRTARQGARAGRGGQGDVGDAHPRAGGQTGTAAGGRRDRSQGGEGTGRRLGGQPERVERAPHGARSHSDLNDLDLIPKAYYARVDHLQAHGKVGRFCPSAWVNVVMI